VSNTSEPNSRKCIQLENTLSIISGRWTLLILRELSSGTKRFAQLQKSLKGISPRTLSSRLQELEKNKIVVKKVYPEVPPRVEYSLSSQCEGLIKILRDLSEWAAEHFEHGKE
jgi:DNA-binding HxlR family transcriptional regulator